MILRALLRWWLRMQVFSGKCKIADCGIETHFIDLYGKNVHTGDIVLLWSKSMYDNDEDAVYDSCHGLTVVVQDKFTTYSDGNITITGDGSPFVMGIKESELTKGSQWAIQIVKKCFYVIDGEHWPDYGFNYKLETVK